MKVFIIGGTGFIGKPTISHLKEKDHSLLVLSRKSHKFGYNIKFLKGDSRGNLLQIVELLLNF